MLLVALMSVGDVTGMRTKASALVPGEEGMPSEQSATNEMTFTSLTAIQGEDADGEASIANKQQLIEHMSSAAGISRAQAADALNGEITFITKTLRDGDQVAIVGFGTFKVNHRAARTGRNPKTGGEIQIAAANVPAFVAGKALKEAVSSKASALVAGTGMHSEESAVDEMTFTSRTTIQGEDADGEASTANRQQLIEYMSEAARISERQAADALDGEITFITETLRARDDVAIVGFGTFSARTRAARTGRNPKTGEEIQIREAIIPSFKAGKELKEAVN